MHNFPITYLNGGDEITIYGDGTKERISVSDDAPILPESLDLKISNKCLTGCVWCHESSTPNGSDTIDMDVLYRLGTMLPGSEVAIGGGDPSISKNLLTVRDYLHGRGIVTNVTINEKNWEYFVDSGMDHLFYGIGYSVGTHFPKTFRENVVLHFISGIHDPELAFRALNDGWKILILGYKRWGRGAKTWNEAVEHNKSLWYRKLFRLANVKDAKIAFDTLAVKQLRPDRVVGKEIYNVSYMGHEGQHSMYVDLVKGEYGMSSFDHRRFKFDKDLKDAFSHVRSISEEDCY